MKQPRPHQIRTTHLLRESFMAGKMRPMIQLPTGAGKTYVASLIINEAVAKGWRAVFVVPAISLIDQTVEQFRSEGITDIGVIQAKHELTDCAMPVQVASVQTLARRHYPETNIVLIDEAHRDFKYTNTWMRDPAWRHVPFIGLSATPWTRGLADVYDDLIIGETTQGLIDQGMLSDFRVFAPAHPDLTGVKTMAGDYHEGQLAAVMADGGLVAGIVSTWLTKGQDRPTLCFAVNRAHAKKLQAEFERAGVGCGYIDAFTDPGERALVKQRFDSGECRVVANVGCLTTGVDWDVRCIILARPTKSEMLYVQMIGRGLRTAPHKKDCLILDHADNTLRMGFVTQIHKESLCTGKKKQGGDDKPREEPLPKECKKCNFVKPAGVHVCPNCGFKPEKQSDITEVDGELVEVRGKQKSFSMEDKQTWYSGFIHIQVKRGYKPNWAIAQYRNKFGVWPNNLHTHPLAPSQEILNYVKAQQIKWAKRGAA